jgi:phosphoglycolate phosphatase-like HAD superfamily hydrolase
VRQISEDPDLPRLYKEASVVFLDCDGIIFDSNHFKAEALNEILTEYPEWCHAAMHEYWRSGGGLSRGVKFEYFFRHILGSDEVLENAKQAAERFGTIARAKYDQHLPRPEAIAFAKATGAERLYVITGAEQEEMRVVFKKQGIDTLFKEVYGSPLTKTQLIEQVLESTQAKAEQTLFIGDGGGDFRAAKIMQTPFIYLAEMSEWISAHQTLEAAPRVWWADNWGLILKTLGISLPSSA